MGAYTRTNNFVNGQIAYGDALTTELDALGSSVNNIVNAQISSGAAISDSKLAQITAAGKVDGAAITGLANLPSGAGELPMENCIDGSAVQTVNVQSGAVATGTTVLPKDDTIPQNTEGDEVMTLAITPKSATNKLKIDVVVNGGQSTNNGHIGAALFQDATAGALAAGGVVAGPSAGEDIQQVIFTHYMVAGTTSETTFKVRAGMTESGTFTFNGKATARVFGGVIASSITIQEIKV